MAIVQQNLGPIRAISGCCLLLLSMLFGCKQPAQEAAATTQSQGPGAWLGMQPTDTPTLLAPELLASSLDEYNSAFSPDGSVFYFTSNTPASGMIAYTIMDEFGHWTEPQIAGFSGEHSEYDPLLSPDGKLLYFSSERPTGDSATENRTNVWKVDATTAFFGTPERVPLTGQGDYHSSIASNGNIYFNVWNTGDLYKAVPTDSGYATERLPVVLNSTNGEGDPFIAPDESYLIYRGYNNSFGQGDLYISFNNNGTWTTPQNLGEPINSSAHEMCPNITPDGRFFLWASGRLAEKYPSEPETTLAASRAKHASGDNGSLNIYYQSADFIQDLKAKAVPASVD